MIQEIFVYTAAILAASYSGWKFIRQFTHDDSSQGKCAKCELLKAVKLGGHLPKKAS